MTVGIAVVVAIGSVSIDAMLIVAANLSFGAIAGILFVWLAHALLPDLPETFAMSRPQQQEQAIDKAGATGCVPGPDDCFPCRTVLSIQ